MLNGGEKSERDIIRKKWYNQSLFRCFLCNYNSLYYKQEVAVTITVYISQQEVSQMYTENYVTGETIRTLRKARGISRALLAEMVGISESHMNKIEAGSRKPSIEVYEKIINVLDVELVMKNRAVTAHDKCIEIAKKILFSSTEKQAIFLTNMLEHMAENIGIIS